MKKKKLFSLAPIVFMLLFLGFSMPSIGQIPGCFPVGDFPDGGFENVVQTPACNFQTDQFADRIEAAMFTGCAVGWQSANYTPDVARVLQPNSANAAFASEGNNFALLGADVNGHICVTETMFINYNFTPGTTYRISFDHLTRSNNPGPAPVNAIVALTNGLTNTATGPDCSESIPVGATVIFQEPNFVAPNWTQVTTAEFTVTNGQNQIAFIHGAPDMDQSDFWAIDNVQILECACEDPNFNLDFHFEDEDGNQQTAFCPGDPVIMNGSASVTSGTYILEVLRFPLLADGSLASSFDESCISLTNVGPVGTFNLGTWASQLGCFANDPILFDGGPFGAEYQVKLADIDSCGNFEALTSSFRVLPGKGDLSFEFENNSVAVFCTDEDVIIVPEAINETLFRIEVYDFQLPGYIYSSTWVFGELSNFNISQTLANQGVNLGVGTYFVSVEIDGPCFEPIYRGKVFRVECCEPDPALDASFLIDITPDSAGYDLFPVNYELYNDIDATHIWYLFSSPTPLAGPFTAVANQTGDQFLFENAQYGLYYFLIHRVITECEDVFYMRRQSQFGGPDGDCEICGPIDLATFEEMWGGKDKGKSRSAETTLAAPNNSTLVRVFPNPTRDLLTVENPLGEELLLTIHNATGLEVQKATLGNHAQLTVDLGTLPGGTYFFTLGNSTGTFRQIERVVLLR